MLNMEQATGLITVIGIVMLIAGVLMLAGGIILLVLSIKSTVGGKKRIGGIVWGGILIVLSVLAFIYGLMMIVLNGISNSVMTDTYTNLAAHNITVAVEVKAEDALYDLCAKKSCSGDVIEEEDIEDLIDNIIGDVKTVDYTMTGFTSKNSAVCVSLKFKIQTADEEYTMYVDYITQSSKDNIRGIQRVMLKDEDGKVCEFGKKPDLS